MSHFLRSARLTALAVTVAATFATAAPTELATGLFYARGADITQVDPDTAAVLDLRLTPAPASAPAWATTTDQAPKVVLLAGPASTAWANLLTDRAPRVLLLGPTTEPTSAFDLHVAVLPDEISASIAAIETDGADLTALALPTVAKRRFDEAALLRHHNGDDEDEAEDSPAETAEEAETETTTDGSATPTDPMLERAAQVLLGLQALGHG
ncbi:hypothetical protein [Actomonas aquatica]|uniref:Uncharacterized protein n=1 Tax=Actomonas aquatica TaxID=2866162 RepID=A0ABZ1CB60_9BACT|nr:hypothetical protein [Opitutus sp. WL0086]WRQ88552.1 hypothetical protein K1X11_003995 [Opitutus sp. WL0086]